MDVSFFLSIVLSWALFCLVLAIVARLLSRRFVQPAEMAADTVSAAVPQHSDSAPAGESLAASRLAAVLTGIVAPLGILWLTSLDDDGGSLHKIAGAALALALMITFLHATRRRALDADTHGER